MIPQEVGVRRGGQDLALCPERLAQEVEGGGGKVKVLLLGNT